MRTFFVAAVLASLGASPAYATKPDASVALPSGVTVVFHTGIPAATAPKPTVSSRVRVHYQGTLADGTEFDSSYRRGTPATFPLRGVIPCWTQALQQLTVGSKATLTCPSQTAYGDRAVGGLIPPNSTLTFRVELLAIEP